MYRNLKECFFFGFSFLFSSNIIYCNDGENLECRQCLKWILSAHCNWIKPILTVTKRQSYCCCCRLFFFSRAIWFGVVFVLATLGLYGIFFQLYISIVWRFFICLLIAAFKIHVLWCFPSRFYHQQRNKLSFRILFLSLSIISGFYFMCVCVWIYLFGSLLRWPLWLWENSKPTQRDAHHMFTLNKRAEKFWKHRHSTIWMQTTRLFHHSDQHFRNIWKCNRGKKSYLKTAI